MKRKHMPAVDEPFYEVCECGHRKVSHGRIVRTPMGVRGGRCLFYQCRCTRFHWSHYDEVGIKKFLDSH